MRQIEVVIIGSLSMASVCEVFHLHRQPEQFQGT